jgi:hypothetical protein
MVGWVARRATVQEDRSRILVGSGARGEGALVIKPQVSSCEFCG